MASYFLLVIMILFSFSASAHEGGKEGGHAASGASRTVNIFVSYKKKKGRDDRCVTANMEVFL